MRIVLFIVGLYAVSLSEIITLTPIEVDEKILPSGYNVLSSDEAAQTADVTLQKRLAQNPSFTVVSDIKGEGALSFRGLDFKATEYVEDGIPLYRSVNGFVDTKFMMSSAPLEINDGSGYATLGVSPMGGEVNVVTKRPIELLESRLDTIISSNDEYYHGYVGSRMGDVYVEADAGYYHRDEFELSDDYEATSLQGRGNRINSDKYQQNVALKAGLFINDQTHVAAQFSSTKAEYGLPPNVYTDLVTPVWNAYSRVDNKELNSLNLYGDYTTDALTFSLRGYYDDYEDTWAIYNDASYQTYWPLMTYDDSRLGAIAKGVYHYDTHQSILVFQAEENEHIAREEGATNDPKFQLATYKGSLLHTWRFDERWQLDGAVTYTLLHAKKTPVLLDDKKAVDALAKLTYAGEQRIFYGSIAKKSRMPAMNEMFTFFPWDVANPELKPERSVQAALGYQEEVIKKTLLELSTYYYDIEDIILYRSNSYINRESAKHYGVEAKLESEFFSRNRLGFAYVYAHAVDSEDEALELIPNHRVKVEDTINITNKWEAYMGYEFVGTRYSANSATYTDEQFALENYHLVDVSVRYDLHRTLILRAGITNMLDENYELSYGFPIQGRSFFTSLKWEL